MAASELDTAARAGKHGDWLVGGGEMAKVIKAMDWSRTALGPMPSWPQSLRTTVSLAQASNSPISLAWGPGHVQIYNDGYWPICGAKHPGAMGQDFRECWASAFPVIGEGYESAWSGKSGYLEKMRMFLDRYGFLEETWFTFSFSPITDESGHVGGLFHPVTEMTSQMLSERRTKSLRDLASRTSKAKTSEDVFALSAQVFEESALDIPFALLYLVDADRRSARLVGRAGIPAGTPMSPEWVDLQAPDPHALPIAEVGRSGGSRALDDLEDRLAGTRVGPYPELPDGALILPVAQPGTDAPVAVLVAGKSPRLHLDEPYRAYFDLLAAAVSTSLANARAYEEEKRKVDALAEIDRAKTHFFSNVSHEFRTPLTLILGPLEDALARGGGGLRGGELEAVHRNALRLLRLVNSLLDFSRMEAGRLQVSFELTDLAATTAGLAESFRSLIESAGVSYVVDCPPLDERVCVDRSHWEKIVLNLVSNAFKFTFEGSITVGLRVASGHVELAVKDTGTGIPEPELVRVFERFHRVGGARGRSFEGTGIGLALVRELAHQHGGTVGVESVVGKGSTFTVSLPLGVEHLPQERVARPRPVRSSIEPSPYLLEAEQWIDRRTGRSGPAPANRASLAPPAGQAESPLRADRRRVLVADDNRDMRDYVVSLLEPHWDAEGVADGAAALERARETLPDLILSDVMMPQLDGFALLRAIREDPATRTIPFVLLSARAGEEAVVGGLDSGADDYLTKPFSSRELLGRVRTHLEMARVRRAATDAARELAETRAKLLTDLERKNAELEAFSYSVSHDLRAPLRSIDGFSQALLEDHAEQLDPQGQDYLRRVRAGARRMGDIMNDLIRLSRVERAALNRETVDLTRMARRIGDLLARTHGARSVSFTAEEGLVADADPRLAEILLENLLANSWKFTGKTEAPHVVFSATDEDGVRIFQVTDNGAGFDEAHAQRLFSPFQRLHSEVDFPGTGIGLATVQRIVNRHGGRVWAQAKIGRGATFYWTFPQTK